jgi:hypothetical protein
MTIVRLDTSQTKLPVIVHLSKIIFGCGVISEIPSLTADRSVNGCDPTSLQVRGRDVGIETSWIISDNDAIFSVLFSLCDFTMLPKRVTDLSDDARISKSIILRSVDINE